MKNRVRNGHSKNAIFPHKKEKANIFPTIKEILGPIVKGASRQVLDKNTLQSVLENWAQRARAEFQHSWFVK